MQLITTQNEKFWNDCVVIQITIKEVSSLRWKILPEQHHYRSPSCPKPLLARSSPGILVISTKQGFQIFILTNSLLLKHILIIQASSMTCASHLIFWLPYFHTMHFDPVSVHLHLYRIRNSRFIEMISPHRYLLDHVVKRNLDIEENVFLIILTSYLISHMNGWQMVEAL